LLTRLQGSPVLVAQSRDPSLERLEITVRVCFELALSFAPLVEDRLDRPGFHSVRLTSAGASILLAFRKMADSKASISVDEPNVGANTSDSSVRVRTPIDAVSVAVDRVRTSRSSGR
jgi:hypothetical protein